MKIRHFALLGGAFLLASPLFATTMYSGGFEDSSGSGSDYDYNDLVFNLSGNSLSLLTSTGVFFNRSAAGALNTGAGAHGLTGTPFWNNTSLDGPGGFNVGWCIFGGGACNGGVGIAPTDQYLATATGTSVNDVVFSVNGNATEQVKLAVTALSDTLGWALSSGGPVHLFPTGVQGPITFTPGGNFVLVGSTSGGNTFFSNTAGPDGVSHFAFFGSTVPEPSTLALFGVSLLSVGVFFRKLSRCTN